MKKVHKIWLALKAEVETVTTKEEKIAFCEDAKALASSVLTGVWLDLSNLLIGDVEKLIK